MTTKLTTGGIICFILCLVSFIVLYYSKNETVETISGLACILFLGLGFGGVHHQNDSSKEIQERIDFTTKRPAENSNTK